MPLKNGKERERKKKKKEPVKQADHITLSLARV